MNALAGRTVVVALAGLMCAASEARADMCISVDVRFSTRTPTDVLVQSMRREVSSIWQPYGVRVMWSTDPAQDQCAPTLGSFDVLVDRRQAASKLRADDFVLGSTHVQASVIEHAAIHIDYEATERTLQSLNEIRLTTLSGHPTLESTEIGRALGRVLAHEIGHVLLAAPNHQSKGLMRPSFIAADLVSLQRWSFTLSTGEVTRLRQRERILGAPTDVDPAGCCKSCSPD